jgi:zinc transport system substrate-binding protein
MNGTMKNGPSLVFMLILMILLAGSPPVGAGGREEATEDAFRVFVSILPQAYFAERIGGGRIEVEVLVQPGQDPHILELTPKQMARLAEADLYFRMGVDFENALMPRIESAVAQLEVVDCREGLTLRDMESVSHEHESEQESEQGDDHEGLDPHVWLSVHNAMQISRTMRAALIRLDPAGEDVYEQGFGSLIEDLEALDENIAEILAPVKGKPFFVFHPAFGYFADDYGLAQVAVEIAGSEPSARQLAHIIEEAQEREVRILFVQPQFSRKSAEAIAEAIDGAVVPIDPLAYDYVENLEQMARAVAKGLEVR